MKEQVYTNYRLLLPDQEILGTLVVRDGKIADIQPGIVQDGQDGQGDYLMPGLIELHTDNLEKCLSPRPGIRWPLEAAVVYHDQDIISAGITTVCDAIAIGDVKPNSPRLTLFAPMIEQIYQGQITGRFAADHRLHLRCEVSYEHVYQVTVEQVENPLLSLISLMDHTPGQRQFVRIDKYKEYCMGKYGFSIEQMELFIQQYQQQQQLYAQANRTNLVELATKHEIALASHDDATLEHVQEAVENRVSLTEFPTTLAAAKEAHASGLQVLMGAPNLILGGSHSGNISARELMELDLVDIISSDYVPKSLLQSVFLISSYTGQPLYKTIKMVTSNPAQVIKLYTDRGSLKVGKRADLITVHNDGIVPRLTAVISQGQRVS